MKVLSGTHGSTTFSGSFSDVILFDFLFGTTAYSLILETFASLCFWDSMLFCRVSFPTVWLFLMVSVAGSSSLLYP